MMQKGLYEIDPRGEIRQHKIFKVYHSTMRNKLWQYRLVNLSPDLQSFVCSIMEQTKLACRTIMWATSPAASNIL